MQRSIWAVEDIVIGAVDTVLQEIGAILAQFRKLRQHLRWLCSHHTPDASEIVSCRAKKIASVSWLYKQRLVRFHWRRISIFLRLFSLFFAILLIIKLRPEVLRTKAFNFLF